MLVNRASELDEIVAISESLPVQQKYALALEKIAVVAMEIVGALDLRL